MADPNARVCPRCGEEAGNQRFCGACGLNLGQQPEIPTRAVWDTEPTLGALHIAKQPPRFTPSSGAPTYELASFGARAGAYILDKLFCLLLSLPLVIVGVAIAVSSSNGEEGLSGATVAGLLTAAISYFGTPAPYALLFAREGERNGQSWGMQIAGVRLVRDDGNPVRAGLAVGRWWLLMSVGYGLLALTAIGGIAVIVAFLWPLWDDERRAGQDFICSTHVVSAR